MSNQNAEWKDRVHFSLPKSDKFLEAILQYAKKSKNICELGSGMGRIEYFLYTALQDTLPEIKALEYSHSHQEKSIELMRQHYPNDKITFIKGDAFDTPFESNTFDLVFSSGMIEHFDNTLDMIKEHERITKPQGIVIMSVPAIQSTEYTHKSEKWLPLLGKYINPEYLDWHYYGRRMSFEEMEALINQTQLEVLEKSFYGVAYRKPHALIRLFKKILSSKNKDKSKDFFDLLSVIFHIPLGYLANLSKAPGHSFYFVCRKN